MPLRQAWTQVLEHEVFTAGGIKAAGLITGLKIGTGEASLNKRDGGVADMFVVVLEAY